MVTAYIKIYKNNGERDVLQKTYKGQFSKGLSVLEMFNEFAKQVKLPAYMSYEHFCFYLTKKEKAVFRWDW